MRVVSSAIGDVDSSWLMNNPAILLKLAALCKGFLVFPLILDLAFQSLANWPVARETSLATSGKLPKAQASPGVPGHSKGCPGIWPIPRQH